ncbi:MAG: glycoside hydrolase family 43 protein [Clostridia bacterium]|nr:glycoside hydrolase family 43 protein [Clostridia bacterium]
MKHALLLLLCFLLLASCGSAAPQADTDARDEPDEIADGITSEETMNPFTFLSPNYTVDGDALTAAPTAVDHTVENLSAAFYDEALTAGAYTAEVEVTLGSVYSSAGLLFAASERSDYGGFEGYAFCVRDKRAYLYEISGTKAAGMRANELAHRSVERPGTGKPFRLRVEKNGNTYRLFFLDDAPGVEPWPEFEYTLTDHRGAGVGVVDNGEGASFSSLTVKEGGFAETAAGVKTYRNPVFGKEQAADPGVLKVDGKYYCYSTSAPIGYYVYVSDDLVNWENAGLCMGEAWGLSKSGYYWAPEVVQRSDGKFVMVASVEEHLGFAVADSPLGPFEPVPKWTYDKSIDGHIFLDDDGRAYLFYVSWRSGHEYGIWACELNDDLTSVKPGTEKQIMTPTDPWEKTWGSVTEGPFVLKHNGLYYLTYSGSGYDGKEYAVGYATSDSPLGPYKRYEANPVLSYTSKLYGPGHHSFTVSPDGSELIIVYHVHNTTSTVHPRKICIDRARFAPTDGGREGEGGADRLEIWGPSHVAEAYPK